MKNLGSTRGVTPSDTVEHHFNMVMLTTTAGDVVIGQQDGSTLTIPNAPVGVWLPCGNGRKVLTATTGVGVLIV